MTRAARLLSTCVALGLLAAPLGAQRRRPTPEPPPAPLLPSDIRVRSDLSQTAAWVGDPVDFVVEVDTAPGVELVAGDLRPEHLAVEGLELGASSSATHLRADGWTSVRYTYRLVAWDTTPPKRIADFTVRFRRPVTAATPGGAAPADEIVVSGASLAMRSTLPDDGSADGVRDQAAALPAPAWLGWLRTMGLGLVALGSAPVVLWVAMRARRPRVAKARPSSRSLHANAASLLDELQRLDTTTVEGRARAYDRIDAGLRAYVAEAERVPAPALTADELRPRLAAATRVAATEVCDILAECEHARFAPADRLPAADALGGTIARLRSALER